MRRSSGPQRRPSRHSDLAGSLPAASRGTSSRCGEFIVETVVDGLILLTLILLMGLFTVAQPFPFGPDSAPILQLRGAGAIEFLIAAAILVLAQRYVRPVIVAFTGRLLISTMGLFLVIVNALVLWAASLIAPDIAVVAQPSALWLLVFAALYTLLSAVMDAVLGLNRPRAIVSGGTNSMWRFLESLPTPRRNLIIENLRLQQIYDLVYAAALESHSRTRRWDRSASGSP